MQLSALGAMQDWDLVVTHLIDHAAREYGQREHVTYWADGTETRTTWAGVRHDALRMTQALRAAGVKNVDSIQQVSFFTNDFDTTTQGIDFVASYSTNLMGGRSSFNLAYNWNDTEVESATAITGLDKVSRLENDLPNHRATLTWAQSWDDLSMFVRSNYFGEYQGVHVDWVGTPGSPGTEVNASAKVTFDAELSYFINDAFIVSVGAQNIFDTKPERLNLSAVGEPNNAFGAKYYETSPMGINGGYWYLKGTYKF